MNAGIFRSPMYAPALRGFGALPPPAPPAPQPARMTDFTGIKSSPVMLAVGGLGFAAVLAIGVGALIAWPLMGYYVGKKLGTKWGWFWGGFGGPIGLAAMQGYRQYKGKVSAPAGFTSNRRRSRRRRHARRRCRR